MMHKCQWLTKKYLNTRAVPLSRKSRNCALSSSPQTCLCDAKRPNRVLNAAARSSPRPGAMLSAVRGEAGRVDARGAIAKAHFVDFANIFLHGRVFVFFRRSFPLCAGAWEHFATRPLSLCSQETFIRDHIPATFVQCLQSVISALGRCLCVVAEKNQLPERAEAVRSGCDRKAASIGLISLSVFWLSMLSGTSTAFMRSREHAYDSS